MATFVITNNGNPDTDPSITITNFDGSVAATVKPGTCFGWLVNPDEPVTLSVG